MQETVSLFTEYDIYLLKAGVHSRLYEKLGSHPTEKGTYFAVWAPNAEKVSVVGDFNGWNKHSSFLANRWDSSGIWEGVIHGPEKGTKYKFCIFGKDGWEKEKCDPVAFSFEEPPKSASIVWNSAYDWQDGPWMKKRKKRNGLNAPFAIYEIHLGSWMKKEDGSFYKYSEIADRLINHVKDVGFTHIEFMPLMEHPFYGSWGYQVTGYFAPTSRYGTPEELMELIDKLHRADIGVIFDWVPSHFPTDDHGLSTFDGTCLYEHQDPKLGFHPDWKSAIFNYGRNEVRSFLMSSAFFWFDKFHIDGLRIDGVASMLYLDYSRKDGEWIPNMYGGNENLESIAFLRDLNSAVYKEFPDVQMMAEESSSWPMVSRPTFIGGLGFGMKWNMGWMHDVLGFFSKDPIHRKYHHNDLTFSMIYAFFENFLLSLSHDEVVYGKGSLLSKMPGDVWQKFANLRLLMGYLYGHPGKKLLFMGAEIGQWREWNHDGQIDWNLLEYESHRGIKRWVKDLNSFYKKKKALHEIDFEWSGFEWIDCSDCDSSVLSFIRKCKKGNKIIVVCNFTPVCRYNYRMGVPDGGVWKEVLNSDAKEYGGSGFGNLGKVEAQEERSHGRPYSISLNLPPLGILFFERKEG